MFVLKNTETGLYARHDSAGQHDGRVTDDIAVAAEFWTYGEASDYGQNFGDGWEPFDLFPAAYEIDMRLAMSREIPSA